MDYILLGLCNHIPYNILHIGVFSAHLKQKHDKSFLSVFRHQGQIAVFSYSFPDLFDRSVVIKSMARTLTLLCIHHAHCHAAVSFNHVRHPFRLHLQPLEAGEQVGWFRIKCVLCFCSV